MHYHTDIDVTAAIQIFNSLASYRDIFNQYYAKVYCFYDF